MNRTRVHVFPEEVTEAVQRPEENHANRCSRAATSQSSPYGSSVWLDAGRRLCRSSTWITALKIQTLVVRNAAVSIASAWISTAFCALGDVFSGKWYTDQSRNELIVSNSVWGIALFCTIEFSSFLVMVTTFRFVETRPTAWSCFKRLIRESLHYFVGAIAVALAFSYLFAHLTSVMPALFKYKMDCYMNTLAGIGYFTGISRVVKHIYHEETQLGRDQLRSKQHRTHTSSPLPRSTQPLRRHHSPFWKAYIRALPVALPSFLACMFVQVLSQQRLVDSDQAVLTGFTVASVVFKLVVQEFIKHYIFRARVRSTRIMCFIVGIPTVLIDTQTRMILLGTNSRKIAAMGTIGMALLEIALRMGKAALVMWEIHQRESAALRRTASASSFHSIVGVFRRSKTSVTPGPTIAESEFKQWRRQVQQFYMAELNADMYAEYVSIGCSASIFFFYGNHAHYGLLRRSGRSESTGISIENWRVEQLSILALQVGVEVVVDYVSIVLEMVVGIEFDQVKKLSLFLGGLFTGTAVLNTVLSVQVFLS